MIREAFSMTVWWQYVLIALAAVCLLLAVRKAREARRRADMAAWLEVQRRAAR